MATFDLTVTLKKTGLTPISKTLDNVPGTTTFAGLHALVAPQLPGLLPPAADLFFGVPATHATSPSLLLCRLQSLSTIFAGLGGTGGFVDAKRPDLCLLDAATVDLVVYTGPQTAPVDASGTLALNLVPADVTLTGSAFLEKIEDDVLDAKDIFLPRADADKKLFIHPAGPLPNTAVPVALTSSVMAPFEQQSMAFMYNQVSVLAPGGLREPNILDPILDFWDGLSAVGKALFGFGLVFLLLVVLPRLPVVGSAVEPILSPLVGLVSALPVVGDALGGLLNATDTGDDMGMIDM